ncbi:MAG: hypothetical protein NVSMB22_28460 [Chloroflexota bacterium]
MFRFRSDPSIYREKRTTTRRATIIRSVLVAAVLGTCGIAAQTPRAAAHPESICLETNSGCANLPPVAGQTHKPPAALLKTTIRPAVTLDATLDKRFLHISGTHFAPGRAVRIVVMSTSDWTPIWSGPLYAQPALAWCSYPYIQAACGQPNPQAGTLDYTIRLPHRYGASSLVVLYRAARRTGVATVTIR